MRELSYREVPTVGVPARGLGQVYKKFYVGDQGFFLSHHVWKLPGQVDMIRQPESTVKAGQWTISSPADTASGVAWLHALDAAHVEVYKHYA